MKNRIRAKMGYNRRRLYIHGVRSSNLLLLGCVVDHDNSPVLPGDIHSYNWSRVRIRHEILRVEDVRCED